MKIGVIGDIHGNHYALKAVLNDCSILKIDHLLILGDIVGYYYHPEIIIELLAAFPYDIIKGNHELILQNIEEGEIDLVDVEKKYGKGHEEALKKLDRQTLNWLYNLPSHKSVELDGVTFQLNHGSPWDINEYLYPDTATDILEKCDSENHDFVLIGHSHYPFAFRTKNSMLINCGSVGQSRQKGGLASWAIVNTQNKAFELRNTPYDVMPLYKEVTAISGDSTYSSKILLR